MLPRIIPARPGFHPDGRPDLPDPLLAAVLRHAALGYAAAGVAVVPLHAPTPAGCSCGSPACRRPGAHPRHPGHRPEAPVPADDIRDWWGEWPDANVGVDLGGSGLVAALVAGASRAGEILIAGQPAPALEFLAPCGGRVFLFRRHELWAVRSLVTRLRTPGPEVVVRPHGVVVLPPSVLPAGWKAVAA